MSNNQIKILGINVSNLTSNEVLESIEKYLWKLETGNWKLETDARKPLVILTPNPEIVVYGQKDAEFKRIVNTAQINLADGVGLLWAARVLGRPLKERIQGVDLMERLIKLSVKQGLTVGLIGGKRGVALKALECLQQKYPGLKGWAEEGPVVPKATPLPQIPIMKPCSFLFVGLGCPKQEYFINEIANNLTMEQFNNRPLVLMAVGGSFDYFSGRVKRAPLFIRLIGFEWLFRLLLQPWRWKRQLALIKFIWLVVLSLPKLDNGGGNVIGYFKLTKPRKDAKLIDERMIL